MLKKPSPLKQFDKFEVLSGVSEEVEKRQQEKEDRQRQEEEKAKTVAEEQKKQEEEEKKLEEERKIQQDTAKYQKRIDAGEITVEQAQKEYKEQIKKEQEEKVTVIRDGKKLSWDQVKEDNKLYGSLTLNEKRKLARGKNLKDIKELGEDITAAPEKSNIDNKPSIAKDLLAHIGRGWTSSAKGVSNQVEAMQFGLASLALNPKTREEKIALHAAVKNTNQALPGSTAIPDSKYNAAMKTFDANIRKYENESITEDLKDGNYAQAGFRTVGAALESMPSLVAAYTGFGGLGVLAASVSGNKFEEEFEKNPEESTGRLLLNAGGTGILESTFELVTRGVMKRAGLLAGQGKVKAAKELLAGGGRNIAKNMGLAVTGGAVSESATEASSLLLESMPKSFPGGLGRDIVWTDHFYQLADAGIVGSFVDGTISTIGAVNNGNQRSIDRAEVILAPKEINDRLNEKIHIINKLAEDLPTASKEGKELINERIENEYQEVIKIKKENSVALQNLEGESLQDYATNKEQIDKNVKLAQKSTNDSEKQEALNRVTKLTEVNKSILDVAKKKAYKKDIETVTKQASTYFGDKVEVVEADTQEKSSELLETSIHERKIALEEQLQEIEDQNSEPAIKIKEEIGDLKADLKDIKNLKKQPGQQSLAKGAYFSHGYITPADQGGRRKIIVNKEAALKAGFVTTGQHEFVHAILNETIKDSPDIQMALGEALGAHLGAIDKGEIKDSEYRKRIYDYIKAPVSVRAEEMLPLLSEAMSRKDLKFNEGIFTGLKDKFRQYFQKIGLKDIEFNNGRDVYNFIKDFNKSVATGKTNEAIQKLAREGAKGKLVKGEKGTPIIKQSKEASDNVQRIYEEQGEAGAMDIIDAFKPITSKLVERRSQAPNFDRQLLTDEIETGKRGIFDLIREYDPKSGVPLAAYINKFLPARAIEASQRVLGEEFTEDITEKVDIAAEEVTTEVKTKPKKKKIVLADRLGVKSKVDKAIKAKLPKLNIESLNFKTLKDQAPEITGEMFGISPKKLISGANITKRELQSAQMFINKNADLLMKMLPEGATASGTATGIPNTLLKAFYTKTDRAKMAKTGTKAGLAIQVKNDIKKTDFLETFGIVNGKPVRTDRNTSARVLALANQTGKMITNQAVREQLMKDNTPLMAENLTRISDGKSSIMFSKDSPNKQDVVFGGINSLLSKKEQALFHDNLPEFVSTYVGVNEAKLSDAQKNKILLTQDVDSIKIALRNTYGDIMSEATLNSIADQIVKTVSKLKIPAKTKNIVKQEKIVEAIVRSTEDSAKKIAKFTGSNVTAAKAQNDLVRQEDRRKSDAVFFDKKFSKNKEQAIADLILLGGSSFTSAKIGDGRGQFYKNSRDYYDYHLGNVGIEPVYNKNGSLNVKATAKKNGLKDIPVTKAAQSSTSAIKDHKNPESLRERRKHEKHARKVLNEYVAHNVTRYKEGLQDNIDIMLMMNSLLSNMNSVLARAAKLEYIEPGLIAKNARYEHMQPRVAVLIKLVDAHINRDGIKNIDNFLANYDIAIINKKFDKAITDAGYQSTLVEGQSLDDSSLLRYYNDKTLTDNRIEILTEVGTNKVPKVVESFMKGNNLLKSKIKEFNKLNKSIMFSRSTNESKGITVLDFDDTLATTKSLVKFTKPDGTTGTLNAEQYANTYEDLLDQGYTFDFSDFNKVVKGKLAPLFNKAIKLQGKFGSENMFVLTARPPAAQKAIFDFLKANGLNIPIKNITGLGNSTAEAKALWMADKVGEGYNDFYFADDALQNVQAVKNMLDQFDVKSKIQQAKIKFSKDINTDFNNILEEVTGIESEKRFSDIKARKRGESKGKFRFFIPPSHEDFVGLLYNFMGKGRKGNQHRDFFEQALVRPLNRAYREIDTARQAIANDYKSLNKQFPDVKDKFTKKTPDGDFTFQDAVRVYLWDKHGYKVPGLSPTDQVKLKELVQSDPDLQAYAETLNIISKQDAYVNPTEGWEGGNIRIDLMDATGRVGRAQYLTEFNENAELLFSEENLNKIEAAYGASFRSALEDMLHRIKTGVNRPKGQSGTVNKFINYLNGSVGSVMFFNTRSAILQQMSNVNYLNFADNNILAAAKAFANQPQYWKDFAFIFNSDMLKQRRGGIGTDINGAELAEAVSRSTNPVGAVIGKLLKLGFLPTQIGDNIAIATGGATFYRNRVNKYIKDGLNKKEAEAKAFTDFQNITQSTQQSARPDMTSQQQAAWIGKLVLNFLNTPSQYNRIIKKAGSDILNRRITPPNTNQTQSDMSNASRILYYGAAQNLIFYGLQTALFAVMFGLDDEDEEKKAEQFLKKKERVINGAIDTILRGSGIYGVAVSTLKNMMIKFLEQRDKGYNKDESAVIMEMLNFSPVIGIKARKVVNAEKTLNYNKNIIDEMNTFDIDNPQWSAVTNYVEATTNAPVNRLYQKSLNLRNAMDNDYTAFQRALFFSGYTTWSLGLDDTKKMKEIKETVKEKKKAASKEKSRIQREEKKKEQEEANKAVIEENKKKSKKDGVCSAISKGGKRCNNSVVAGKSFCTVHEKVKQNETGKKSQCKKIKSNGKRCGMQTSSKSGYCYYHD